MQKIFSIIYVITILFIIQLKNMNKTYVYDGCYFELENYKNIKIYGKYRINENWYEGFVENGKPNGRGKCTSKNYQIEGIFDDGYIFF
jgi:hypothetical protein